MQKERTWKVEALVKSKRPVPMRKTVKTAIKKILNGLDCSSIPDSVSEISIVFTDDSEIRELNASYRDKDYPTDVLSFSQLEGDDEISSAPTSLGDVVISVETAERQAEKDGRPINEELLRLLIHGILHLFGYDHENVSEEEAGRMRELEERLFHQTDPLWDAGDRGC